MPNQSDLDNAHASAQFADPPPELIRSSPLAQALCFSTSVANNVGLYPFEALRLWNRVAVSKLASALSAIACGRDALQAGEEKQTHAGAAQMTLITLIGSFEHLSISDPEPELANYDGNKYGP